MSNAVLGCVLHLGIYMENGLGRRVLICYVWRPALKRKGVASKY